MDFDILTLVGTCHKSVDIYTEYSLELVQNLVAKTKVLKSGAKAGAPLV